MKFFLSAYLRPKSAWICSKSPLLLQRKRMSFYFFNFVITCADSDLIFRGGGQTDIYVFRVGKGVSKTYLQHLYYVKRSLTTTPS